MKRIMRLCALLVVLCLLITGCNRNNDTETTPEITLPEPSSKPVEQFLGEEIVFDPQSVTFYYISDDGTSLSTIIRNVYSSTRENLYKNVVELLLSTTSSEKYVVFPENTEVLNVEVTCGIATVDLSLDARNVQNEHAYLMLLASISNTLLSMEGVEGVNLLINDRSMGIVSLPCGVQTSPYAGITPAFAQLTAESDYFLNSSTGTISRTVVLYFPTLGGEWFIPELRTLTFDSDDYASALLDALGIGPMQSSCALTAVPDGSSLLQSPPTLQVTSSGEHILQLDFSATLIRYLAFANLDQWELLGSVALTLCSFIPDLDAICVMIDGQPIESMTINGIVHNFKNGYIHREDFRSRIGSSVVLYYPNAAGELESAECALSIPRVSSPLSRLQAMLDGVRINGLNPATFPEGILQSDILGIQVRDGIANVNLSANFYRQCQALDAAQERGVIYAIVNTLCEMENISGVHFCIEGISAETLSGSIYLKGILLPNPSYTRQQAIASPEIIATP